MKRALAAALLLGQLARAEALDAGVLADAPLLKEQTSFIEVARGAFIDVHGKVHEVEGGAHLSHEDLIFVAQSMARLHAENLVLKVVLGIVVTLVAAAVMRQTLK